MQFALNERTDLKVTHLNKRLETHGQEKKHAMDISWRFEGPNTVLDTLPGFLRDALYYGDATEPIEGVVSVTRNLRTSKFDGPLKIIFEGSGYLVNIQDGPVSEKRFELGGSDLKNFKVDPKPDGFVVLTWISQHVGLTPELMARIMGMDGKTVSVLFMPPEMQDGTPTVKLTKAQEKAAAKAAAQAAFTSPFKFGVEGGELVDRTPLPDKDKNAPEAGEAFAAAVTEGKTTPATAPAKKAATKKTKPRTGKGS